MSEEIANLKRINADLLASLKEMLDAAELLHHPRDPNRRANHAARIARARAAIGRTESMPAREVRNHEPRSYR